MDPPTSAWPRPMREPRLRAAVLARPLTAVYMAGNRATDPPSKTTTSFGALSRSKARPDSALEKKADETQLLAPFACRACWKEAEAHLTHSVDAASVLILMASVLGEFIEWSRRPPSPEFGRRQHVQGMQLPCV
jgi:hypothetical protein